LRDKKHSSPGLGEVDISITSPFLSLLKLTCSAWVEGRFYAETEAIVKNQKPNSNKKEKEKGKKGKNDA
jgi:hypothetical protein